MNFERQEIRTGLLVVVSLAILVGVLIYLGSPGVFGSQKTYRIYFDNAAGMKRGAQVLLAGRKIGQVERLYSPVPENERPKPKMEALVEVKVASDAPIYKNVKVTMAQPKLLGDMVIDFTSGEEASGLAPDGQSFIGERGGGLADAVPAVLEKIDPALKKATETLDSLQKTADNLTRITAEGSDLPAALTEFRKFGTNLNELSGPNGSLRHSLANIESLTGPDGKFAGALDDFSRMIGPQSSLCKTFENTERFTADLAENKDLGATLRNFRRASEKFNATVDQLGPQFSHIGTNLEQASETVKREPWRLIWPSTKKYEEAPHAVRVEAARPVATPKRAAPRR
ncbi:MAG: phospholipid/cholesterol/gamma-HCH transport system substrate-binding protein [Chthoniobacter sp.]|jgi:phospholipid/cholesterol/gamma-HCH transport system substrate-binding protein|nr:phospholipid/cholesterol/gamma-HCH transport system substrate-binding protein [Chthoniobacter sp.]